MSATGWPRSAPPSGHKEQKAGGPQGRSRFCFSSGPLLQLGLVLFPVGFGLVDDLFEGAGGIGALGDVDEELVELRTHLLVHPEAGVEVFVVAEHLNFVLHEGGGLDLGVADALGVLDVVVAGLRDRRKDLGVLDILHIEHEVFGPAHLAGKADVVGREKVAAVELVPEHAVKIRSGLVHQAEGEGVLVVDACGQEAVFPRFRRAGNVHDAEIVLDLFQHLPGLGCPGGDDHGVGRDDEVSARLLRRLHQQSEEFLFDWTQQKSCPHHYQKKMRYRHHCSHFDHQLRMLRSHLFAAKMFR